MMLGGITQAVDGLQELERLISSEISRHRLTSSTHACVEADRVRVTSVSDFAAL